MAILRPINVYRPTEDKFGLVSCRAYDDYEAAELAANMSFNPYSFLNIVHLAYHKIEQFSHQKRFNSVHQKFLDFVNSNTLEKENKDVFYVYEITQNQQTYTGIVGAIAIKDYLDGKIKKHENTLEYRVNNFKDFLSYAKINTEPVLLTYDDNLDINSWIQLKKQQEPDYFFSTTDHQTHKIWTLKTQSDIICVQEHFSNLEHLYIADGHHRLASASAYYQENTTNGNAKYCMAYILPYSQLKIWSFYRLVQFFPYRSMNAFLNKIQDYFSVKKISDTIIYPKDKYEFVCYHKQKYYLLKYKKLVVDDEFGSHQLDCYILQNTILEEFFGVKDIRNDERISYYPSNISFNDVKQLIDNGDYKIAFMVYPTSIEEIKQIADINEVMPPKSTYILPKFRSGLFIYPYF